MKPNPRLRRMLIGVAVGGVLLSVFAAYLRPDVTMMLATQLWNCF